MRKPETRSKAGREPARAKGSNQPRVAELDDAVSAFGWSEGGGGPDGPGRKRTRRA